MSATTEPHVEYEDGVFDASTYHLPAPEIDGREATDLRIRFSGTGQNDRTSSDDVALLEAMRLGREVRLIVTGTIAGKGFNLRGADDEELAYYCTVRVLSVEAGELA